MTKAGKLLPIVEAELQSDLPGMERIIKTTPPDDPNLECFEAIAESRRSMDGDAERARAALKALSKFLDKPPGQTELFQVLLMRVVRLASRVGNAGEASRAMRLLDQLGGAAPPRPEMKAGLCITRAILHLTMGETEAARKELDRALEILGPRSDRQWCSCKAMRIQASIHMGDWRCAERDWADIKKMLFDGIVSTSWAFVEANVLESTGRNAEALAVLEAAPEEPSAFGRRWALVERIWLLFKLRRDAEARALLEGPGAKLPLFSRATLNMQDSLLHNDLDAAREHARKILTDGGIIPAMVGQTSGTLAALELASGRPRTARLLLRTIDPEEGKPEYAIEWARLHLLEGNEARAVERLREALGHYRAEQVRDSFTSAHEISAAQMVRLWTLASQATPPSDAVAAPVRAARPKPARSGQAELVGGSPAMVKVRADIDKFATLDETVLVTGETGTGKELVARLLHDRGPRAKAPFLAVNCAAISDTLLESELFGHVRGAFTGAERAHEGLLAATGRGTIFFDEIGSMSPRVQASLLRVLEERKVRPVGGTRSVAVEARVVAATNQPLEDLVKAGTFRQDLYYRLARLEVRLAPLRERREDIPLLARHFLGEFFEPGEVALGDDLLDALRRHDWPGNVRELRNAIERIALLGGESKVLGAEFFRGTSGAASAEKPAPAPAGSGAVPLRGARGRMLRLRQLFGEHRELSRGDVAHLLGCAPATAAKMLAALETEGFVKRVWPTAAARTSYFVIAR